MYNFNYKKENMLMKIIRQFAKFSSIIQNMSGGIIEISDGRFELKLLNYFPLSSRTFKTSLRTEERSPSLTAFKAIIEENAPLAKDE